jgi:thiosulfate dehydrogenase
VTDSRLDPEYRSLLATAATSMSGYRSTRVTVAAVWMAAAAALSQGMVAAAAAQGIAEAVAVTRGGAYYDNWFEALEKEAPAATHPSYPAGGRQSGADTWRCKECHGWDYKGVEGAYGTGSHFTGIKGIDRLAGMDPASIIATIRDPQHGYTAEMLPDSAVAKLALFVSRGQIDVDQYIDRATKKALGDAGRGNQLYRMACYACHGPDGRRINFASASEPEFVGTLARDNPWELLHKIRNGQPGTPMIALNGVSTLSIRDQVAILAYAQTLPVK